MPNPQPGESQQQFVDRCVPIVLADGTAEDSDQAVAVCNQMWDGRSKQGFRLEYRNTLPVAVETREDGPSRLVGHAAVFYRQGVPETEFRPFEGWVERIRPGAFRAAIERKDDVRAVFDHGDLLLGRTKSGTLRLSEDDTGLRYEVDLPNTNGAKDLVELIQRGDISGSSFKFIVDEQDISEDGDETVREIRSVSLFDVGPVIFPAYEGTSVTARSRDHLLAQQKHVERQRRLAELTAKLEKARNK